MNDTKEELLPFSKQAEEAIVGACIWEGDAVLEQCISIVKPEHFFSLSLGRLYSICIDLQREGRAIDAMLVFRKAEKDPKLVNMPQHFIEELSDKYPTVEHITDYCDIVAKECLKRTAIQHALSMKEEARETDDISSTISDHIRRLESVSQLGVSDPVKDGKQWMRETIDFIQAKKSGKQEDDLIPTGLTDLDNLLNGGLRRGHFDILAARPAMGKTSLAVQFLLHNTMSLGNKSLFFSIEMPDTSIGMKSLSTIGKIPYKVIDSSLEMDRWDRVLEVATKMGNENIFIDMQTKDLNQMLALIRKYARKYNVKFVVIDYLQLITIPGKYGTRDSELGHCVNELAYLAKVLNINILCLSQLNRSVESRESKVPILSDLRESGNIEQSAWRVLAIHREEYYNPDTEHTGLASIHVLKGKVSNVGKVEVVFDKTTTRFADFSFQRYDK
tara:strand:- start:7411 stop:8745 length:1335 start_codon:yes stop_codon:yes gene_type:complete